MRSSTAEKRARIDKLRDTKPDEQLQHLYVDSEDEVRDRHVERMWNTLYTGEALDDLFKENFSTYYTMLLQEERELPDFLFANVSVARAWVAQNFGLLHVAAFDASMYEPDPELSGFTHMAQLRTRYVTEADKDEFCYAPSELYAVLLTVVNVYRHVVTRYVMHVTAE